MVSFKVTFIVSLLLASVVDQVYSTACFSCEHSSTSDNSTIDCLNNPAQLKYAKPCDYFKATSGVLPFAVTDKNMEYKCLTVKMTTDKKSFVFKRSCSPSYVTCDLIKNSFANGLKLETCRICDGDLCNASSKASIAIFTLISCLITSYIIFK